MFLFLKCVLTLKNIGIDVIPLFSMFLSLKLLSNKNLFNIVEVHKKSITSYFSIIQ